MESITINENKTPGESVRADPRGLRHYGAGLAQSLNTTLAAQIQATGFLLATDVRLKFQQTFCVESEDFIFVGKVERQCVHEFERIFLRSPRAVGAE